MNSIKKLQEQYAEKSDTVHDMENEIAEAKSKEEKRKSTRKDETNTSRNTPRKAHFLAVLLNSLEKERKDLQKLENQIKGNLYDKLKAIYRDIAEKEGNEKIEEDWTVAEAVLELDRETDGELISCLAGELLGDVKHNGEPYDDSKIACAFEEMRETAVIQAKRAKLRQKIAQYFIDNQLEILEKLKK